MSTSLGISLKLSPEAANSLRQRRQDEPKMKNNLCVPQPQLLLEDETSTDQDAIHFDSCAESEDWDDMMAIPPEMLREGSESEDESSSDVKEDVTEDEADDDEDDASLSPPPSLPVVVVNLERLCGYLPSTAEEAQQLQLQVEKALLQDDDDGVLDSNAPTQQDNLSRNFEERTAELFEMGTAFHGDTSVAYSSFSLAVVSYPEYLCRASRTDRELHLVMETAHEWKRLLRSHSIPVVNRIMGHLVGCSRPLSWKVDMNDELRALARNEQAQANYQKRQSALTLWRTQRRRERLDKLYQVRETFAFRLETTRGKLAALEEERDEKAAQELRRRVVERGQPGGFEALDFETTIFAFPTDDALGLPKFPPVSGDSSSSASEYSGSGYESDDPDSSSVPISDIVSNASTPITSAERVQARRKKAAQKHRRKLAAQEQMAKQALENEKVAQARTQEERAKEKFTTPKLLKAQAVVNSLEDRLHQVDDLLESLQEEEWADEEEGIFQDTIEDSATTGVMERQEMSLLDQILAMILGSLPRGQESSEKEHYDYVQKEHFEIIEQWRDHFGRLPASLGSPVDQVEAGMEEMAITTEQMAPSLCESVEAVATERSALELRQSLGIEDNDATDNWDDVADWDELFPSHEASEELASSPPKGALRPGGRVMR